MNLNKLVNLNHDWAGIKAHFERHGIVEIENFFCSDIVHKICECLRLDVTWDLIFSNRTKGEIITFEELQTMDEEDLKSRVSSAYDFSEFDFQYIYQVYKLVDNYLLGRNPKLYLNRILESLNHPEYINFMRQLTSCSSIIKMDAMVARYNSGHFLTQHDDGYIEEGREVTYIHNLTHKWRPEWGGILHITEPTKRKIRASFTPKFNSLVLFKPPMWHFVSQVSSFTPNSRYTLTGWMLNK